MILDCLPININNIKPFGILFTKEKLKEILNHKLPNINHKIKIDNIKIKNPYDMIFNIFSNQKNMSNLFHRTIYDLKGWYLSDVTKFFKYNQPEFKKLFKININDKILNKYKKKIQLIEELSFLSLLSLIKICPNICFTYQQIFENFKLTEYKLKSLLQKFGLKNQIIHREISDIERMTLNGYRMSEKSLKETKKEKIEFYRPNYLENKSLYKESNFNSDKHLMPVGFKIQDNYNSILEVIDILNTRFENKFYINTDVLIAIKSKIENKNKYIQQGGFKKCLKKIKIFTNSIRNKKYIICRPNRITIKVPFKTANRFFDSCTPLKILGRNANIVFRSACAIKIKTDKNLNKNKEIIKNKPYKIRKDLIKCFFKSKLPDFYDNLTESQIDNLVKNSFYQDNFPVFDELYNQLGCNSINSDVADRLNILNEFRTRLKKLSWEKRFIIKDTIQYYKNYCLNLIQINTKEVYSI